MDRSIVKSVPARVIRKFKTVRARMTCEVPYLWPANYAVISFTFDDFPASAAHIGAEIIERFGARATFYSSFSNSGLDSPSGNIASAADAVDLDARGHEIGCHTFSHMDC